MNKTSITWDAQTLQDWSVDLRAIAESSLESLPDDLSLDDILDREEAQQFQDAFAAATGVASVITYPDGRPFTRPSNFCRLCADLIRKTKTGLANCMRSDAEMGLAGREGPVIYKCLSGGLIDAGCRIMLGQRHVGTWLIGQVICGPVDMDEAVRYAETIGVDVAEYTAALDQVPRMSRDRFEHIVRALSLIAGRLSNAALKNLVLSRQVEQLSVAERRLHQLALNDPLTGLPNRALANDRLRQAIAQAQRANARVALLFVDLDQFKQVNDTRGHSAGDVLLCEAADRLRSCCRAGDTVARLGGDEFMILLPMQSSVVTAECVARKVVEHLSVPFHVDGHLHHVTASVGIALYPDDALSGERLLSCADIAMYRVKAEGRNGVLRFSPEMHSRALRHASLEDGLGLALERCELILEYQPIHRFGARRPVGIEALPRWRHPTLGICLPGEFIPLAEETGAIVAIGNWVMEQACLEAMAWSGVECEPFVSVNLSVVHLNDLGFFDSLARILDRTQLPPERLCLEFTEDIMNGFKSGGVDAIKRLRAMGVSIAIDHFGVGSSALSQFRQLPIDILKVDSVFIRDLPESLVDRQLLSAIATMGRNLGIRVVGQCVETQAQADCVESCGCECIQGYWKSRPIGAADLGNYLQG